MSVGLGFFFGLFEVFLAGVLAVVLVQRFHLTKDADFLGDFSISLPMLVDTRFLAGIGIGIGIGAELPVGSAHLADLMPRRVRVRAIAVAFTVGFLGVPAVGLLDRFLLPCHPLGLDGWRWLMVFGSLGAVIIWFLRRSLPESPRWLESVGRLPSLRRRPADPLAVARGGAPPRRRSRGGPPTTSQLPQLCRARKQ